jgi:hypothetical protein
MQLSTRMRGSRQRSSASSSGSSPLGRAAVPGSPGFSRFLTTEKETGNVPACRVKNDPNPVFAALFHCLAHLFPDLRLLDIHLVYGLDMPLDPLHQLVFTLGFLLEVACQAKVLAPERFHLFHRLHRPAAYTVVNIKLLMMDFIRDPEGHLHEIRTVTRIAPFPETYLCSASSGRESPARNLAVHPVLSG